MHIGAENQQKSYPKDANQPEFWIGSQSLGDGPLSPVLAFHLAPCFHSHLTYPSIVRYAHDDSMEKLCSKKVKHGKFCLTMKPIFHRYDN